MGKKLTKRVSIFIVSVLALGLSLSPTGFAAGNLQNLQGFFSNIITIFSNGHQVNLGFDEVSGEEYKPLVVNNRVYIPIRALSEVIGKEVAWTQATNRVDIVDRPDKNYDNMLEQIKDGEKQIKELEEKVRRLEHRLESQSKRISNLIDMEDYLNDQYYIYNDIRFYIYLSGDTKDINVKVYIDHRENSKWSEWTDADIEEFIEAFIGDIRYHFQDASIIRYIENDYSGKKGADFELTSRGRLEIDTDYISGIYDLNDMAEYLNDKFARYEGYDFHVKLYWDLDNIRVDVFVLDTDWLELGQKNREKYLNDIIYKEINREFPFEGIYGYIFDNYFSEPYTNYVIQSFEFDHNGKLSID